MGDWKLVVPLGTTNMVLNPSAETTGNFGNNGVAGVAVTRSTAYSFRGLYSYKVVNGANAGCAMSVTLKALTNAIHYLTFWAYGTSGDTMSATFYTAAPALLGQVTPALLYTEGDWRQYGVQVPAATAYTGTGAVTVYIYNTTPSDTYYVDCVQVEALSGWTTYCDGDQPGCKWNGTRHGSTSYRWDSREGGAVRDLITYYGLSSVQATMGYSSPTKETMLEPLAFVDGSVYQGTRASGRILQLECKLKGTDLANYYSKRKALLLACNRHHSPQEPCLWYYTGAGKTVALRAFVESGDEGGLIEANFEKFTLNLMAVEDPYWEELREETAIVRASASLSSFGAASLQTKVETDDQWDATTGAWSALGITALGGNHTIYAMARDNSGNLYVGGDFLNLNGIDEADYIAKRDVNGTWTALASGTGGIVRALACDVAGNVYVGGDFTNLKDANGDFISMWNGSAFASVGGGAEDLVRAIVVGRDGSVYVGGDFAHVHTAVPADVANTTGIAKWSGAAWSALGTGVTLGATDIGVTGLDMDQADNLYAAGWFTEAGGVAAADSVAKWNGTAWSSMGVFTAEAMGVAVGKDQTIYAIGHFSTINGASILKIGQYKGSGWYPLGSGITQLAVASVRECLAVTDDGTVYAAGSFVDAGGVTVPGLASWNGTSWIVPSIVLPTGAKVYALYADGDTLYIGHDKEATGDGVSTVAGTASLSVGADVTSTGWVTNSGTAISYPVIAITTDAAATVKRIENLTTKQVLQFNDEPLPANGWITIDCRKGKEAVYAGYTGGPSRIIALKQPSDLGSFCLLPGGNKLSVLCYGDGATVTCSLRWRIKHEGMDGGAT